jgi:hypothetical protein
MRLYKALMLDKSKMEAHVGSRALVRTAEQSADARSGKSSFWMKTATFIPAHDLVVVRMGHQWGDRAGMRALRAALAELMAAVENRSLQ